MSSMRTIALRIGRLPAFTAITATLLAASVHAKDPDPAGDSTNQTLPNATAALPAAYFKELLPPQRPSIKGLAERKCFDTEFGWIFCREEPESLSLAEDMRGGSHVSTLFWRRSRSRAVVTVGAADSLPFEELGNAGAVWVMPWLDSQMLGAELQKQARPGP